MTSNNKECFFFFLFSYFFIQLIYTDINSPTDGFLFLRSRVGELESDKERISFFVFFFLFKVCSNLKFSREVISTIYHMTDGENISKKGKKEEVKFVLNVEGIEKNGTKTHFAKCVGGFEGSVRRKSKT